MQHLIRARIGGRRSHSSSRQMIKHLLALVQHKVSPQWMHFCHAPLLYVSQLIYPKQFFEMITHAQGSLLFQHEMSIVVCSSNRCATIPKEQRYQRTIQVVHIMSYKWFEIDAVSAPTLLHIVKGSRGKEMHTFDPLVVRHGLKNRGQGNFR